MSATPDRAHPSRPRAVEQPLSKRAFARVELYFSFEEAADAWAEVAAGALASPYQSLAFASAWTSTVGARQGVSPLIVVARDDAGAATALLPLGRFRRGPLVLSTFLGGRFANYQMGLFHANRDWTRAEVEALLVAAARQSRPRVDAFIFMNQPAEWGGASNPFAALARQASPSDAYATVLPNSHDEWLNAHFSKPSRKKLRKKARKLEAIGPMAHTRARGPEEIRRYLETFRAQKHARGRALGARSEFDAQPAFAMLERLAAPGPGGGILELHALRAGERIVAVFGGLAGAFRLHGLILSFDVGPDVATSSPGELLVIEVARDAIARGFIEFDLGIGEARYKSDCCERTEPLFDGAFAITISGRLGAAGFLALRALKRRVKRSPRLYALALSARRWLG